MIRLLSKKDMQGASFSIHPLAKPAFQFYQQLNHQFDPTQFNSGHNLTHLLSSQALLTIKINQHDYQIFSGFEHHFFDINQVSSSRSNVLIYPSDFNTDEIEEIAWVGVMRSVFSSIRSDSLGQLYTQINENISAQLMLQLFGKSHLSELKLANISCTTRSTISKQKERINLSVPEPTSSISIFEQLVSGNQDDQRRN